MKKPLITIILMAVFGLPTLFCLSASGQGTAFTYQGQLQNNGIPATGTYVMTFAVYNTNSGGLLLAGPLTNAEVNVVGGLFTVVIDFGAGVFTGATDWLEIGVATNGSNSFSLLSPRQQLTPVPYAISAATAAAATTAASVPAAGIGAGTANINITGSALSAAYAGTAVLAEMATTASTATNLIGNVSAAAVNWPAINAMPGGGTFSATNPVTTCFTNTSFAFGLPMNVTAGEYNQPVIAVTNSSGSPITITPNPSWYILPNSIWVCTNWSMVTVFIYPGVMTNAACTPIF